MRNTYRMKHIYIIIALLSSNICIAQTDTPRLVVSIVVDQLRSDLLEAFSPMYGDGGFKRLLTEGRVYQEAQYPFVRPDRASAVATLYSGCAPYSNGVVGARWFDRQSLRPVYSAYDPNTTGIGTAEGASPRQLAVSTLTDELKIATGGSGIVFAISPFRDAAIYSAGHAANAAVWIDDNTGQWCTTSYYGGLPSWADGMNKSLPLSERIKNEWEPVNELVGNFDYFTTRKMREPFKHKFTGEKKYVEFKTSGLINEEVGRMATVALQSSGMGLDAVTDILALTFYAGNYQHKSCTEMPIEQQDIYVRLDRVIADIIDRTEQIAGKGRVLFILTSTGYQDEDVPSLERYHIPTGSFSMVRAASLLNMYLGAVYGQERWVEAHYGSQIFLSHKLIEDKSLNINEMLERCADFLIQMSGVKDVYTSQRLALGAWTPGIKSLRNSINPKYSGDIILDIQPGWHLLNEDLNESIYVREGHIAFPIIFYGSGICKGEDHTPVETDCVAAAAARMMRIRVPNACSASPLRGLH